MLKWIETTGKTERAAINAALEQLGLEDDNVSIEVITRAKTGFLGIGSCPAKIRVTYEVPDEPEEVQETPAPEPPVEETEGKADAKEVPAAVREEPTSAPADRSEAVPDRSARSEEFLTGLLERLECPAQPMVYCGIYTEDGSKYPDLRDALEKLQLNDASLSFEPESSVALGFGFRVGFLGMLHMEIIQERLEREFDLDLVTTLPSVIYEVLKTDGSTVYVDNPHNYPDPAFISEAREPFVNVSIISPQEFVGNIMPLCQDRRGQFVDMQYLDTNLVEIHYKMPLNEIIYDFFDTLKAHTKGYASLDYELADYQASNLVKVDLLLNGDQVDALSFIVHKDKAYKRARKICEKLRDNIPRQLFEVPVQAAIGGKIIARETVRAMRKDVLAKCYGGDITRKKKLLEKQKEGKKKMRNLGTVQVPTEAFLAVLKLDE